MPPPDVRTEHDVTRWRWILVLISLLVGALALPVAAYVIGGRIIGPYQGARGLGSYLGAIYTDIGRGQPFALIMVLAPALCLTIWSLRTWLSSRLAGRGPAD